mmetsp:Transcript_118778/g.288355  ORF Transcript_118778/g.288355 Transcript_118778/m.288355 type:complete len:203 (-) Transcript_118778:717-1325(-)
MLGLGRRRPSATSLHSTAFVLLQHVRHELRVPGLDSLRVCRQRPLVRTAPAGRALRACTDNVPQGSAVDGGLGKVQALWPQRRDGFGQQLRQPPRRSLASLSAAEGQVQLRLQDARDEAVAREATSSRRSIAQFQSPRACQQVEHLAAARIAHHAVLGVARHAAALPGSRHVAHGEVRQCIDVVEARVAGLRDDSGAGLRLL